MMMAVTPKNIRMITLKIDAAPAAALTKDRIAECNINLFC